MGFQHASQLVNSIFQLKDSILRKIRTCAFIQLQVTYETQQSPYCVVICVVRFLKAYKINNLKNQIQKIEVLKPSVYKGFRACPHSHSIVEYFETLINRGLQRDKKQFVISLSRLFCVFTVIFPVLTHFVTKIVCKNLYRTQE